MKAQYTKQERQVFCELKESRHMVMLANFKRSFNEFLLYPTIIIGCFVVLAIITNYLDRSNFEFLQGFVAFMEKNMFFDIRGTSALLGSVVAGVMTMSTFTITMLLIVVQQSASYLSSQVLDQFLRSRNNQIYFGYFLGLTIFSLLELATVNNVFNPVIGAAFVFFFAMIALFLLIILVYTTINQMRPGVIIETIHHLIIKAREQNLKIVAHTRNEAQFEGNIIYSVRVRRHGYVVDLDIDQIAKGITGAKGEVEVEMLVSIGEFINYEYKIALVKAEFQEDAEKISRLVCDAIGIEHQHNINHDPAYGIGQLENIGWTSISTAKSNPHTGILVVRALSNILLYWGAKKSEKKTDILPIVYKDNVKDELLDAFENLGVVSAESMQHHIFYRIFNIFCLAYFKVDKKEQERIEKIVLTLLSVLGDHTLTEKLEKSLYNMKALMIAAKRPEIADAVKKGHKQLDESRGKLNSRATRVKGGRNQ